MTSPLVSPFTLLRWLVFGRRPAEIAAAIERQAHALHACRQRANTRIERKHRRMIRLSAQTAQQEQQSNAAGTLHDSILATLYPGAPKA